MWTCRFCIGVDKKGDWLIYDKKGNVIPVAQGTEEDKSVTGNGLPKFTGSMTVSYTHLNVPNRRNTYNTDRHRP